MKCLGKERLLAVLSRKEGTVSVEMVLLFPVFALIVVSILEFGHLWMVRHTLTIATREGARAAVVYFPSETRVADAQALAQQRVTDYLQDRTNWVPGTDFTVPTPSYEPNPETGGVVGGTLTVRAQTTNALLVLHQLITNIPVVAETTMRFE